VKAHGMIPQSSPQTYDARLQLTAIVGDSLGGTVSSPEQVFLFHHDRYLGTALKAAPGYTSIVSQSGTTVTVLYKYPVGGEALCCPSGHGTVRFHWNGSRIRVLDPIPPVWK
jgi:hypothetical protein